MFTEKCSPYLTASDVSPKPKRFARSEVYALSKERKNIVDQLQLMRIRIKQLEREEQKARIKSIKAETLAYNIIDRRQEKSHQVEYNNTVKKLQAQQLQNLKERNQEIRESLKSNIAAKKVMIIEENKNKAKDVKETQANAKKMKMEKVKSASVSPRQSPGQSRFEKQLNNTSKIEEEKVITAKAQNEIHLLEDLEKCLIDRLKAAYTDQKIAEEKVVLLINHPVICSKQELNQLVISESMNKSIS